MAIVAGVGHVPDAEFETLAVKDADGVVGLNEQSGSPRGSRTRDPEQVSRTGDQTGDRRESAMAIGDKAVLGILDG